LINQIEFYNSCYEMFGQNHKSLGWNDSASQEKRFEIIKSIGIKNGDKVLDVGCGFSDLYFFLKKERLEINYHGIDTNLDFVDVSNKRLGDMPNASADFCDINTAEIKSNTYDWVVSSGLFPFEQNDYLDDLYGTLKKMYHISSRGISFNLLSNLVEPAEAFSWLMYNKPEDIVLLASSISRKFKLMHDYLPNDMTCHIIKG
jgi:cyclopropane fatty-acyl-phospholipid synthase-like methyltransferase